MKKSIAIQNTEKLASLSFVFCLMNDLNVTQELSDIMAMTIMAYIAEWYSNKGLTFDAKDTLIADEAISYAFKNLQELTDGARFVAQVSAATGIGLSEI